MNWNSSVSGLWKAGPRTAKSLKKFGIGSIRDLVYYFPFRYEDYSQIVPIAGLQEGQAVTVRGKIELLAAKRSFRRRMVVVEALLSDQSGSVRVVWFNQPYVTKLLEAGDEVFVSGVPRRDMLGFQFASPQYEKIKPDFSPTHTARLVPIYHLTAGVTEKQIRGLIKQALGFFPSVPEWLPEEISAPLSLFTHLEALQHVHFPTDQKTLAESLRRLKFEELFLLQLRAELARMAKVSLRAPEISFQEAAIKEFVAELPFALTKAQKVAAWEILQAIQKKAPMNRLLSGDVGSGKTVVAAMALYNAALNGFQGILMVPTEILATQHYASLCKLLGSKGVRIAVYTRSQRKLFNSRSGEVSETEYSKAQLLKFFATGETDLVIGTHALLTEGVEFKQLGLVIVDEQHRFGVAQRRVIKEKGERVHFLSMTATPIPRSLALLIYGDLDISIINELPVGRKKILSRLVEPAKRERAYEFIRAQIKQGRQAFVVCPLIEGAADAGLGTVDKKSVLNEYAKLSEKIFPDLRVSYLHGKLKPDDKEAVMRDFAKGQIDILVSTSVVEVGVDIPNASVMMIEGAERFGLAQLHQFRGRVGRSVHQSYCLLFTDSDSATAKERLVFFETHQDGFQLAEKDLEIRGPGEVYGTTQSGLMELRLAKLTDRELIRQAKEAATNVAPLIKKYPLLLKKVKEWEGRVHLE